jgi:cell division protein FtsB
MRIRRSVVRIFGLAILPALSVAVVSYFGYNAVWGERGYMALTSVETRLTESREKLAAVTDQRRRLEKRITLLKAGDTDLVEELARTKLMDGAPGQVAIPRDKQ